MSETEKKTDEPVVATTDVTSAPAKEKKVLVKYQGELYDVTNFIDSHPGGPKPILEYDGKDMTEAFDEIGHSKKAMRIMEKYRVYEREPGTENKRDHVNMAYVKRKLFTREDEYFIHKTFGLLSLFSFVYRYCYMFPKTGSLGFTGTMFDYITLGLHMALSTSSLIFHVLRARITTKSIIIWEEYRLHAITFTLKACSASTVGMNQDWLIAKMGLSVFKVALPAFMFAHLLIVDEITRRYGTPGVTSVRNADKVAVKDTLAVTLYKKFFSVYQFCGAGSHLIVDPALSDMGFNTLIAIQSSAFLMTLFRKSLIKWYYYLFGYSACLIISLVVMLKIKGPLFFPNMVALFLMRSKLHMNKYVLWTLYVASVYLVTDTVYGEQYNNYVSMATTPVCNAVANATSNMMTC